MLRELSIRNFAIIDDLSILFEDGLTVLTGETGAGKSIIINAMNLILGGRASSEMIRSSEETAELEAFFEVPPASDAARIAEAQEIDLSEGLMVRRTIHKNGRHRIYVNGRLATSQTLSQINVHLASIAGQHAHQGLIRPEHQLLVLDQYGDLLPLREKVAQCHEDVLPLIRRLATLKRQSSAQAERCDLLEFQVREIQDADIIPEENDELEQERQRLKHAERLYETVDRCVDMLYGADGAVVENLSGIAKELHGVVGIDEGLSPAANKIETATLELEDVAGDLQGYLQNMVFDTERLEVVEDRLDMLGRLKRKYGGTLDSVLAFYENARKELQRVSSLPEKIIAAEADLDKRHQEFQRLCRELSEKRKKVALRLAEGVQEEVASLGMAKTRFDVRFKPVPVGEGTDRHLMLGDSAMEASGIDRVEFLIAPNVGEDLRPLIQIASGGELSRIILALKAMLATKDAVETLVFDEVDAGIGGAVAEMVGEKMAALARFHQVICITHLPQIARFGKNHFRIEKAVSKGRTRTSITPLKEESRVKELARMLGGVKITDNTLAHARELLNNPPS